MDCMLQTGADLVISSAVKVGEDTKQDFPEYINIQYHKLSADTFLKAIMPDIWFGVGYTEERISETITLQRASDMQMIRCIICMSFMI